MDISYPHALSRLVNTPLLITPDKAQVLLGVMADRANIDGMLVRAGGEPMRLSEIDTEQSEAARFRPYQVVDGIAVVPIEGTLVHRLGSMRPFSGMTGYDGISANIALAVSDPLVRGIVLDIHSPGGEVSGVFDLADEIRAARAVKPIRAILNEHAFSAAYALASQASDITVARTGGAGSIGVVWMHADFSEQLASEGINVTLVFAGAHKVDGNPFKPLPDEVRAEVQDRVDDVRVLFANTVAAGRHGALTAAEALQTEARSMTADALEAGLVDQIAAPDAAFAEFAERLSARPMPLRDTGADGPTHAAPAASDAKENDRMFKSKRAVDPTAADVNANNDPPTIGEACAACGRGPELANTGVELEAAHDEGHTSGLAEGTAAGATAERARISAIVTSEAAEGREAMATHLALETDMAAEAAIAALEAAPKATAGGLGAIMAETPNAPIEPDGERDTGDVAAAVASINQAAVASINQAAANVRGETVTQEG